MSGWAPHPHGNELTRAAPSGPLVRVRATIAYDGTGFHGAAANIGVHTVLGTLGDALAVVLRQPVELICAGRTDAGVHARAQVVHFDAPASTDLNRVLKSLNRMLNPDIAVSEVSIASDPAFHARFDATWRHYRYQILNRPVLDPALARTTWHVVHPLSLPLMRLASDAFIGEHDFASFCRHVEGMSSIRRVISAEWHIDPENEHLLRFEIRATAFCQQMVRSIVGFLIDVGRGRHTAGEVTSILAARNRALAGQIAPPHGLTLWEVGYPASGG
jgi:tRNA pseudouridine38-40 synthase